MDIKHIHITCFICRCIPDAFSRPILIGDDPDPPSSFPSSLSFPLPPPPQTCFLSTSSSIPPQICVPYTGWDFAVLSSLGRACCLLSTKEGLDLKGGFTATQLPDGRRGLLFTGSPRVCNLAELKVGEEGERKGRKGFQGGGRGEEEGTEPTAALQRRGVGGDGQVVMPR